MVSLITVAILASLAQTFVLFVVSRRRRRPLMPAPDGLFFVVVVACLNEELVISRSLRRWLDLAGSDLAVLVVDDGSDDATSDVVRAVAAADPRVSLLRREAPNARQGKGEALNAAFRHLCDSDLLAGRDPDDVIVVVLDADGRLARNALADVAPYFRDPRAGAVQVAVRMYNGDRSLLTRMQDIEFITFTEVFQRARQRVGSVGLGGNGQFARLSALQALGRTPWTDCLTEDLDLGIRLLAKGWTNGFCPTTYVEQQAVESPRRLLRQRSRWFQGHLQCLRRIPLILTTPALPLRPSLDLMLHLLGPILVLLTSVLPVAFALSLLALLASGGHISLTALVASWQVLLLAYLLGFGMAWLYAYVYWLADAHVSLLKAVALGHVFCLYGYLWFPAAWWAMARILRRRHGWAKTARSAEGDDLVPARPADVALPMGVGEAVTQLV